MRDLKFLVAGNFWTRLPELVEDIENITGHEVLESNYEYIVTSTHEDDDEVQYMLSLEVAGSTIVIKKIEEVYRG